MAQPQGGFLVAKPEPWVEARQLDLGGAILGLRAMNIQEGKSKQDPMNYSSGQLLMQPRGDTGVTM